MASYMQGCWMGHIFRGQKLMAKLYEIACLGHFQDGRKGDPPPTPFSGVPSYMQDDIRSLIYLCSIVKRGTFQRQGISYAILGS